MGDSLTGRPIGVGGFPLGILVLAFKDWLTARSGPLLDFVHARLAGSAPLRRTALAKYTRALHDRHRRFAVSFQGDEDLIRRFLTGWPWRTGSAVETARTVDQVLGALRDTPQIMALARNPLLLTMIAYPYDFVYAHPDQVLPHTRAEFYRQVIDSPPIDRRRTRTAFHLGEPLTVPEIAEEPRTAPVPSDVPESPDWVWRPFARGADDSPVRIAGRIAVIVDRADGDTWASMPVPDPRIVALVLEALI